MGLADLIPEIYDGDSLGEALAQTLHGGEKILIPRASKGNANLVRILEEHGARVDDVPTPFWLYTDLVVAFLISFGRVKAKSGNLKSVKKQESAKSYERSGSLSLQRSTDSFVNRIVTQRTIKNEKDSSSSSSGSGGSSSHTSSSGRSHGSTE